MTDESNQTTGGAPVEGVDPGGTRPTQPNDRKTIEQDVESGDRNDRHSSTVAPVNRPR